MIFIKLSFKPIKRAEMFPGSRGFICIRGIYSFKPIILHNMVLRRDVASFEIPDKANRFRMNRREAHELGPTGSRLPFRNFTTGISEAWVKDVGGASPGVEVAKCLAVVDGSAEDLNGSNACHLMRGVVVEVGRMGKGHGPEGIIFNLRPIEGGVDHHVWALDTMIRMPPSATPFCHLAPTLLKRIDWTLVAIS
jgi:hypothetical protein